MANKQQTCLGNHVKRLSRAKVKSVRPPVFLSLGNNLKNVADTTYHTTPPPTQHNQTTSNNDDDDGAEAVPRHNVL